MRKPLVYRAGRKVKALLKRERSERTMKDAADRYDSLQRSFDNRLGDYLADVEAQYLGRLLEEYRGKRVAHLSGFDVCTVQPSSAFQIVRRVYVAEQAEIEPKSCVARFESLPFDSLSVDVVILQHVLEYSLNPQQVLKEAARVVDNGGHIIIVGFNPLSSHGLWSYVLRHFRPNSYWRRKSLLAYRVHDWLNFLDFSLLHIDQLCHALPIKHRGYLRLMARVSPYLQHANLPMAPVYGMVSRKDVISLNKPKTGWKSLIIERALAAPKPAQQAGSVVHLASKSNIKHFKSKV